jgi:hypothetical protein
MEMDMFILPHVRVWRYHLSSFRILMKLRILLQREAVSLVYVDLVSVQ